MKKMNLKQFSSDLIAFGFVSLTSPIALFAGLESFGIVDIPSKFYLATPLTVYGLAGIRIGIGLTERLNRHLNLSSGNIQTISDIDIEPRFNRKIPLIRNGQTSHIFANIFPSIFPLENENQQVKPLPVRWIVPINDNKITVREKELEGFLEICAKRRKYQFSRNYWTIKRKPPMPVIKYNAFMRLLEESGLIENRYFGASGYLKTKPHFAITYLKFESQFRI